MTRSTARRAVVLALPAVAGLALWLLTRPPHVPPIDAPLRAAGLEPRYETLVGLRVRYVRQGSGAPVLLLHGFASSIYTWKDVLPALAARHEVVALDFPGFGGSEIPRGFDPDLYPRVALALLDRLQLRRAALVGNSLGGAVAIRLAARHPERVTRLVLVDSAGFNFAREERPWILRFAGGGGTGKLLEALPGIRRPLVRLGLKQVFHDDALVTPERVAAYLAPLVRPGSAAFMQQLLSAGSGWGFPGVVQQVRAPTLVVWGEDDTWIPVAHARRFADEIPGARVAVIPSCGHTPQEERPEAVARLIGRFLEP